MGWRGMERNIISITNDGFGLGFNTYIKLTASSKPVNIHFKSENDPDFKPSDVLLMCNGQPIKTTLEGDKIVIDPSFIALPDEIYNIKLYIDNALVLKGFLEWQK